MTNQPPGPITNDNRAVVLEFFRVGLQERQPGEAFARFVAADFVEHKPDVADPTRDGSAAFLQKLMGELPSARWEVVRTVAEDDMVALHVRFVPETGAPPYAIVDLFRVRDRLIVEHWDVVAGPPADPQNPHPRF